jgi:hypothetical protein
MQPLSALSAVIPVEHRTSFSTEYIALQHVLLHCTNALQSRVKTEIHQCVDPEQPLLRPVGCSGRGAMALFWQLEH